MFHTTFIIFGLLGLAFLGLGLYGLIRKRPFAFSARWMLGLMFLSFSPGLVMLFWVMGWSYALRQPTMLINFAMYAVLIVFLWYQMSGYMVLGVSSESMRSALLAALDRRGLAYEERLSAIHLPALQSDLQVMVQDWTGIAQLRMKRRAARAQLGPIVSTLNEYFAQERVPPRLATSIFYVVFGVLTILLAVASTVQFGDLL